MVELPGAGEATDGPKTLSRSNNGQFEKNEAAHPQPSIITWNNSTVKPTIKTFADNPAVAANFAIEFVERINELAAKQPKVTVALSGGSTPKLLFSILAEQFHDKAPWEKVHLFWGDERMVEPTDPESNYGEANRLLLSKVEIPASNVHRVLGESDSQTERARYESEILENVTSNEAGVPVFDILLLGMGSDGHTASIFPHEIEFLKSNNICEVATHPESGQQRITLTGKVLNAANSTFFLVTGESKASVLAEIINKTGNYATYPTSFVEPPNGSTFYLDSAAATKLA